MGKCCKQFRQGEKYDSGSYINKKCSSPLIRDKQILNYTYAQNDQIPCSYYDKKRVRRITSL